MRIGFLYLIAGFGGSLMSSLFIQTGISVGASGALFGLLGSMLSELITNWTIYANKARKIALIFHSSESVTCTLSYSFSFLCAVSRAVNSSCGYHNKSSNGNPAARG